METIRSSLVVQRVRDLALSPQQLRSLLWHGFHPWPQELLHAPGVAKKERKKKMLSAELENIFPFGILPAGGPTAGRWVK